MAPKRFGSVRELPSGRFQARYRPRTGTHRKALFDSREEAEAWLRAIQRTQTGDQGGASGAR